MWNPETYVDTDYGLDDGESFEPDDAWEPEPFDQSLPHVMTVLGPISPDDLGIAHVHEYVTAGTTGSDLELAVIRDELEFFVTAGGGSMVDAATPDAGRNLESLLALAQLVPVNLLATAGRGQERQARLLPGAGDEELLHDELLADMSAPIKPGLLAFGTSKEAITTIERAHALAVCRVAAESGYPVAANPDHGVMGLDTLDLAESAGLSADRVIVGQMDSGPTWERLAAIAGRGAWLSFDRVGNQGIGMDRNRAATIVGLAEAGYGDQILVSQSLSEATGFITQGGAPGWIHLIERFTLELMNAGADAMLVRKILIDNPARALTILPPDAGEVPIPV